MATDVRSAAVAPVLGADLFGRVRACRLLVVGAGGIGCELLKNLVLSGFGNIDVVDLDTIDVTNLNRQFLFRKEHVNKSKAEIARQSVLKFNPAVNITAHHGSIMGADYDLKFFEQFSVVMNALDNLAARNHVNRMCQAANIPLIESGTAGYLGQVTVIKKGVSECYECYPKPQPKQFPVCTIRNTPSAPIHCIVWAKHLFSQLFGEADDENDVAPDSNDPELKDKEHAVLAAADGAAAAAAPAGAGRKTTRKWAEETEYNPVKLFDKLFFDDMRILLSLDKLWLKRKPPVPLSHEAAASLTESAAPKQDGPLLPDQRVWSMAECAKTFVSSVQALHARLQKGEVCSWDKDDDAAMDFVCAASNLRSHIFGIPLKTRFDAKSMAGNIIPAIATTNAVIAGLIVMEAFKLLAGRLEDCRSVFLCRQVLARNRLLNPIALLPPNPKCYVCSSNPEITLSINIETATVATLVEEVLKKALGLISPSVSYRPSAGQLVELVSSDEEDLEVQRVRIFPRTLKDVNFSDGTKLRVFDDLQRYNFELIVRHSDSIDEPAGFKIGGSVAEKEEKPSEPVHSQGAAAAAAAAAAAVAPAPVELIDDEEPAPKHSRRRDAVEEEEEEEGEVDGQPASKRRR